MCSIAPTPHGDVDEPSHCVLRETLGSCDPVPGSWEECESDRDKYRGRNPLVMDAQVSSEPRGESARVSVCEST